MVTAEIRGLPRSGGSTCMAGVLHPGNRQETLLAPASVRPHLPRQQPAGSEEERFLCILARLPLSMPRRWKTDPSGAWGSTTRGATVSTSLRRRGGPSCLHARPAPSPSPSGRGASHDARRPFSIISGVLLPDRRPWAPDGCSSCPSGLLLSSLYACLVVDLVCFGGFYAWLNPEKKGNF